MKAILWIGVLAVVVFVLWLAAREKGGGGDGKWPFHARKVLSEAEQILYWRLLEALPDHIVLAQVALSRLLEVNRGFDSRAWHNRISQKSVDFVVCGRDSAILAVIELDDASHGRAHRKKADADKDQALASAGVRVLRWQAVPDEAAIREAFRPPNATSCTVSWSARRPPARCIRWRTCTNPAPP